MNNGCAGEKGGETKKSLTTKALPAQLELNLPPSVEGPVAFLSKPRGEGYLMLPAPGEETG